MYVPQYLSNIILLRYVVYFVFCNSELFIQIYGELTFVCYISRELIDEIREQDAIYTWACSVELWSSIQLWMWRQLFYAAIEVVQLILAWKEKDNMPTFAFCLHEKWMYCSRYEVGWSRYELDQVCWGWHLSTYGKYLTFLLV